MSYEHLLQEPPTTPAAGRETGWTARSGEIGKLAEALAKAQGQMSAAKKGTDNSYFKSKYADLAAVWDVARKPLADNGLAVSQTTELDGAAMVLRTSLVHSSGQWISGAYRIKPVKDDPQAVGSATTYARRYAFASIVGVVAENEDDDGNAGSGRDSAGSPPQAKSVFKNAALRNTFCKNVIESFANAQTIEELKTLSQLNEAKLLEMKASGDEHDALAVQELRNRYEAARVRIKGLDDAAGQLEREFKEREDGFKY